MRNWDREPKSLHATLHTTRIVSAVSNRQKWCQPLLAVDGHWIICHHLRAAEIGRRGRQAVAAKHSDAKKLVVFLHTAIQQTGDA